MKQMLIFILLSLTLLASTCKKEGKDCHYYIKFQNNLSDPVIFAIPVLNSNAQCKLDGNQIKSKNHYEYRPYNWCIENSIGNDTIEFYVIDNNNNTLNQYYSCDSIEHYNTILKHYMLTLEDLKNNSFTITYP